MGTTDAIDVSDLGDRDFMSMALEMKKKANGGAVQISIPKTAGIKASEERAQKRAEFKQAFAAEKGLASALFGTPDDSKPAVQLSAEQQAEADAAAETAAVESEEAAAKARASKKAAVEGAAVKASAGHAAISDFLKAAAAAAPFEPKDDADVQDVPLRFTSQKIGAGVSLDASGSIASAGALTVQLGDQWIRSGRKPMIWTVALELESVLPDTTIGVVGRNFWPGEWERSLATSTQALVLRCGDGSVKMKGKATSFVLRPITSGARLHLVLDMQTQELTVELVGKKAGEVLSSMVVDGLFSELTVAVGFAAGAAQRVRIVGCTCMKPEMELTGKLRKDLWDEDNKIHPLPLDAKANSLELQQNEMIQIASSLGD